MFPFNLERGCKMTFEGALLKEQNVTFAIVIVKRYVLQSTSESNKAIAEFAPVFGYVPVILMAQDSYGVPEYYGRRDIVNFLRNVPISNIPWRKYTLN